MKRLSGWIGLLLLAGFAHGAEFRVMDLELHPGEAWNRVSPVQEQEDDALGLSWPASGETVLQVLVPRRPPLIKGDAETFFRNLTLKWTDLYGKQLAVGWFPHLENSQDQSVAGQLRWLIGRRPSQSGNGVVFHLATVHGGRAYSMLVLAPEGTEALPPAARDLITSAGVQAPVPRWGKPRGFVVMPKGEALAALAQAESETLGEQGMLTGYGFRSLEVEPGSLGVAWDMEGFRWAQRAGRDTQQSFELRGSLKATAPESPDGTVQASVHHAAGEQALEARIDVRGYCGGKDAWRAALAALNKGAQAPLRRLAKEHSCADAPVSDSGSTWQIPVGERKAQPFALDGSVLGGKPGYVWVEVSLQPAVGSLGEGLLGRLALVFVYEPE